MGNFSSKMVEGSEEVGMCVSVDTSKKVDICALIRAQDEKYRCYSICLSDEQFKNPPNCNDAKVSLKTSCNSPHCATYIPTEQNPEIISQGDINARFDILIEFCNKEQMKAYNDAIAKADESGNPVEVCCGVKSSNKQLGAIIGGTVAGVVVVAAVAVVVWMAVAKKGCFAKKNKTDVEVKAEPTVLQ